MEFEKILSLDELELKGELQKVLEKSYKNVVNQKGFLYAEGTVPVLLIAHLDTVHKNLAPPICWSKDGRFIMSPNGIGGDDRCGVYMVLQLIKELKCHVLFCEQEETGCIGAKDFCKSDVKPDVNYIIEFDRKGSDDSVFYDCDNTEFEKFVNSVGFKTAWGSCSDISQVAPHLGIAAVNLSSGYYNAHSLYEFIDMHFVERNIQWAKQLIMSDYKTKYEYIKKKYTYSNYYSGKNTTPSTGKGTNTGANTGGTTTGKKDGGVATVGRGAKTKNSVVITKLLMWINPDLYWVYETEWNDCPLTAKYYIDSALNAYIEYNGVFERVDCLNILGKESLYPPEFIAKNAKLCDVNLDDDGVF